MNSIFNLLPNLKYLPLHTPLLRVLKDKLVDKTDAVLNKAIELIQDADIWVAGKPKLYELMGGKTPTLPAITSESYAFVLENYPKYLNKELIAKTMVDTLKLESSKRRISLIHPQFDVARDDDGFLDVSFTKTNGTKINLADQGPKPTVSVPTENGIFVKVEI